MSDLLNRALELASNGISIFVCKPDKTPATSNGFYDATRSEETIREWYSENPNYLIGVPAGLNNLLVLDGDEPEGIKQVIKEYPDTLETLVIKTGGGGLHFYFIKPDGYETKSVSRRVPELPGFDIKADGGYVIMAGWSTKGEYSVLYDNPIKPLPDRILELLKKYGIIYKKEVPKENKKACNKCIHFDNDRWYCEHHMIDKEPTMTCVKWTDKEANKETVRDDKGINKPADPDPEIHEDALKFLREGRPIDYIMDVWHRDYVGGEQYGRMLIFSAMCGTCNNTMGLHPACDGRSGVGKSYAMQAMSNLIHQSYMISGTISPKALFYNDVNPGSIIFLDDVGNMPDDLAQVIKIAASQYQQGTTHRTVGDKKGEKKFLQKCLNWWINGVNANSFDIQILNRNVNIGLDEPNKKIREDHDRAVYEHQLSDAMIGRPAFEVTREVKICREITGHLLSEEQINVSIPYLKDDNDQPLITWTGIDNARNFPIFLDMIRVSASIHRYQRKTVNGSIVATIEDYINAYQSWDRVSREQVSKLNKRDQQIIQALTDLGAKVKAVDIYMLAEKLKKAYGTVYYWLKGREKEGIKGLLDRCDDISVIEQTETEYDKELTGEDGFEREKKIGSKSKRRLLMRIIGDSNQLDQSSGVVSLDKEKASIRLEKYLQSQFLNNRNF